MNDTYQPSPDDVEAAARLIAARSLPVRDWETLPTQYRDDFAASAVRWLTALHARGWRDAEEVESVTYLRTRLDTLMAAHSAVIADRDAAHCGVEAMERMYDEAEEAMGDAHLTGDTGDKRGEHVLMLPDRIRALRADRDALADQVKALGIEKSAVRHYLSCALGYDGSHPELAEDLTILARQVKAMAEMALAEKRWPTSAHASAYERMREERDALAARVKELEREVEDADAAIAIIEHTMMEDGGFDAVAWAQRNNDLTRRLATSEARAARLAAALHALVAEIRRGPAAMAIDDNVMVSAEHALAADTAEKGKTNAD